MSDDELPDGEISDEVIGVAFRRSLAALVAVALLVAAGWWFWPRPQGGEAVREKDTTAIRSGIRETAEVPDFGFRALGPESGIDFVHFSGAAGRRLLPETMGGGVALFDFDNNGTLDILFVSGTHWPGDPPRPEKGSSLRLYANDGSARFRDVTQPAGLDRQLQGMGCAIGDFDNDGWLDLFITAVGRNVLFRNDGGRFAEVTERAGVAGDEEAWSTAAGFFDYDQDGWLDLMVCNYVRWTPDIDLALNFTLNGVDRAYGPPTNYEGTQPWLYRNRGDGTFEEVAAAAGLHVVNPDRNVPVAKSLGVLLQDFNGDGWDDIVVANDTVRNFLFLNQRNGTFIEQGVPAGLAYDRAGQSTGAMGIDAGCIFNDQAVAIAIGNFANQMSSVYVATPGGETFVDEAAALGIGGPTRQRLTFGTLWEDFDLDGRLDLLQVNGHIEDSIQEIQPSQAYRQPAQLFWNRGPDASPCFVEVPADRLGDLATPVVGRGVASGDLDGDGDSDLVVTQIDGPPLVLLNGQRTGNRSLRLRLDSAGANRFAFGARIGIRSGPVLYSRTLSPARSYLSQNPPEVVVGLGQTDGTFPLTAEVSWPGGPVTAERIAGPGVHEIRLSSDSGPPETP